MSGAPVSPILQVKRQMEEGVDPNTHHSCPYSTRHHNTSWRVGEAQPLATCVQASLLARIVEQPRMAKPYQEAQIQCWLRCQSMHWQPSTSGCRGTMCYSHITRTTILHCSDCCWVFPTVNHCPAHAPLISCNLFIANRGKALPTLRQCSRNLIPSELFRLR
jgi:hypothetical protein